MSECLFRRTDPALGEFTVRRVELPTDLALLYGWLTHPKSVFWMMQAAQLADVESMFRDIAATTGHDAFLGCHAGQPAFLIETYDPANCEVAEVYESAPGDIGMHFLTAPTEHPVHGFTLAVLRTVVEHLFADPSNERIVVEPDVRNHPVHVLNEAVGFRVISRVSLRDKDAYLSTCTREQYRKSHHSEQKSNEDVDS
ncbi:GNAT family N-acetyltransferase [Haloactinomyces albus]|uniref:Lysine N-acyltransferase MbtK n=1 Tax=Haloactinomyces albus TaxID=1352928 RepID=A0AAE3ZJK0_9ACTN|nr:GNAT family N-acetyltransferase [Haloactinomyces albus]MDR7304064.1 RimJ/RimL family protein N-acetyltransferase [Haloactinomyces albus]